MHELTHLQTNFSVSAVAQIALCSRLLHFMPQESKKHQLLSKPLCRRRKQFPKAGAEARRRCGLQFFSGLEEKKRQYLCLLIFQGPYLFIRIDLPQAETPLELQLPSANPLTVLTIRLKEALFSLHPPHVASLLPRAISWEKKSFKLHGSGKD